MTVKTNVKIDNVLLPRCREDGVSYTPNKLYAENSGRSKTTGDFIGDVIAIKYDITLSWESLIEDDFNIISQFADNETVEHSVNMSFDGQTYTTKQCYISDLPRTIRRQRRGDGKLVYSNITLHMVEI